MTIPVACPNCRSQHQAPDSFAGMACRCPCGGVLQVPMIVTCDRCGQQHVAPEELAGLDCECPCGAVLQIPLRPAASPAGPQTVFDELTESDLTHQAEVRAPVAVVSELGASPRLHPSLAKAMDDELEVESRGRVPVQITLAGFCLGAGGCAELVAATLAFLVLMKEGAAGGPSLMSIVGMVWGMIGVLNIVVAIMVLSRAAYAQWLGLIMATVNLVSLSPRLMVAAVFVFFSLASSEATAWYRLARAKRV